MEQFDPYYKWLGIGPNERPINHYRLLGLRLFEADGDVISYAADRQMAHIRSFQAGQHAAESQRLLNELAAAQGCLLQKEQKAAYDSALRRQLTPPVPPAIRQPPPVPPPAPAAPAAAQSKAPAKPEFDISGLLGPGATAQWRAAAGRPSPSKSASAASGDERNREKAGLSSWLLGAGVAIAVVAIGVALYVAFGHKLLPRLTPRPPPASPGSPP